MGNLCFSFSTASIHIICSDVIVIEEIMLLNFHCLFLDFLTRRFCALPEVVTIANAAWYLASNVKSASKTQPISFKEHCYLILFLCNLFFLDISVIKLVHAMLHFHVVFLLNWKSILESVCCVIITLNPRLP